MPHPTIPVHHPPEPAPVLESSERDPERELTRRLEDQASDRRRVRAALVGAVILHGLLLLFKLPAVEAVGPVEPPERKVYKLAPMPRWRTPEPPPPADPETPETPRRPIPVPEILLPVPDRDLDPPPHPTLPELPGEETWFPIPDDGPPAPPAPVEQGPIAVAGDVVAPAKIHTPQPRYPEAARRLRLEAGVVLRAVIDRQGSVVDLEVVKAAPFGLTEAALDAVERWRFEPARLHGEPVAVFLYLSVDFRLR